jgi:hypothetical protein
MLGEIERKLTAILGDSLVSRNHLQVVEGSAAPPTPGKGVVQVAVTDLTAQAVFDREQSTISSTAVDAPAVVRRILPLKMTARIGFSMTPQDNTREGLIAARGLILDDISLAAHALAAEGVRDGSAFHTSAPDPGFEINSFLFQKGTMPGELTAQLFSGELLYQAAASIWPPGVSGKQGKIVFVDPIIAALPLDTHIDAPAVRVGTGTRVRVRSLSGQRLKDQQTSARALLSLAVTVVSDLPFEQRGRIASGEPGIETGFRIVSVGQPETVIDYTAPAGSLGTTRVEFVAIHMATPDGRSGTFLGSVAVPLVPGVGG